MFVRVLIFNGYHTNKYLYSISFDARRIKSLEGQKIYDVYYWEEVIQEDGDGGKVVVCRKKTEVRRRVFVGAWRGWGILSRQHGVQVTKMVEFEG